MRILWFSNRPPSGATGAKKTIGGSWIESLENELKEHADVELGIAFQYLSKEAKEIRSKTSSTRYFSVPRHPYSKISRWAHRFFLKSLSEKPLEDYLQIVDQFQPDLVLFFGTESDFPLIIPKLTMPSVIWFQGNLTVYERMFETGITIQETFRLEKLKSFLTGSTMYHNHQIFKKKVTREKKIFSFAQHFIGRTDWDRRIVSILSPQAEYHHCDESMREAFWMNQWHQKSKRDKFIITTTIRGNLYKGLETVYEACSLVNHELEGKVEWRVIGVEENSVYAKAARRKVGIFSTSNSHVNLLGTKTGNELVNELLNADLYIHPSHIENSPNGVQEAMLLGMPVIATNVGGTPSLLTDGKEGVLLQNKDPFALAGAILELYREPKKALSLGQNARKRALIRNDSKKICDDLLNIFEQVKK